MNDISRTKAASGWNYTVRIGMDNRDGKAVSGTADKTFGGWSATERKARQKAQEVLEREA